MSTELHIPWNSHEDQTDQELHKTLDEEDDEDKASHKGQSADHRLAVSDLIGDPSVDHETKNFTNESTV